MCIVLCVSAAYVTYVCTLFSGSDPLQKQFGSISPEDPSHSGLLYQLKPDPISEAVAAGFMKIATSEPS